jgi:hypothetical protein
MHELRVAGAHTGARRLATSPPSSIDEALVSMAWNASTDNSGNFSYRVRLWGDPTVVTLPKTQTSYTWTGLRPGVQYYFWVEIDASGNKSTSDLLVVETERDTTPPSPPGNLNVDTVTASQVSLSWDASTDDSGIIDLYQVTVSPVAGTSCSPARRRRRSWAWRRRRHTPSG